VTFALRSRQVVLPDRVSPATLVVDGGRITRIADEAPSGIELHDVGDRLILPALTDTHVHVNEPGRTEWEGFETATRAAAVGGVTMIVDMPLNSDPVTTSLAAFEAKLAASRGKLWVDCGFWGGVVPGNADELAPMAKAGVLGFKCFTCFSGIDEFPASTEADLLVAMPILRDAGVPLLVHAELESDLINPFVDASPRAYARYLHSRPPEWEDAAVAMVARLVEQTGCPAHIVHLSSAGALDTVRRAKARGLPLTAETCPHYLGLAADEVPDGATEFKCAPPIRDRDNQNRLWAALVDGTLDFVVTDHSPCIPALKRFETGDFGDAWGGIASLQLGLRSVWTEARRRGVPLETVVRWMSRGPAAFLGRGDRGVLREGAVADLVVFEAEVDEVLRAETLLHRHPTSPWVGRRLAGRVCETWMRGQKIAEAGAVCGGAQGQPVCGANHGGH
jgi:allantoinase